MTLGQMAAAIPASRKWVLNAHAVLGLDNDYSFDLAKTLALTRVLELELGLPLKRSYAVAQDYLQAPDEWRWGPDDPIGVSAIVVDKQRFLSNFAATLSFALEGYAERRRGRRRKASKGGVAAAREYGVDVSLLEASLERSAAQRLRRLDQDAAFLQQLWVEDS